MHTDSAAPGPAGAADRAWSPAAGVLPPAGPGTALPADVARAWYAAISAQDAAAEAALRASHFVAHPAGGRPLAGSAWEDLLAAYALGFADYRLVVDDLLAEGERVAVRWTFHGTHDGPFWGLAPTGRAVCVSGHDVLRIGAGRIKECWTITDRLAFLEQLGVLPAADATE